MSQFMEISVSQLEKNPFDAIGTQWCLITAGKETYNTMTASWGQMGILWNRPIFTCYIRSNRYTYQFVEQEDYFTISLLTEDYRKALQYCGSHSGREEDKFKACNLTPLSIDQTTAVAESELIFVCKKLYAQDMDLNAMPGDIRTQFYQDPLHRMYVGEIIKVLKKI